MRGNIPPETESVQPTPQKRGKHRRTVALIALGALILFGIPFSCIRLFYMPSESMENTLLGHDAGESMTGVFHQDSVHDHILVNELVYHYSRPQNGDIVVFTAPKEADAEHKYSGVQIENVLAKRIIGVPGDIIEIKGGRVYRNGQPLDEYHNDKAGNLSSGFAYSIREPMDEGLEPNFVFGTPDSRGNATTPGGPVHLKPRQYWVMGDNRNDSNDSRYWGPLDEDRFIGKVALIYWPLSRVRMVH